MTAVGNYVRAFPHPVLEEGNLSFERGLYDVQLKDIAVSRDNGAKRVRVVHRVENARLIEKMLDRGKFAYGCAIASPLTGYRRFFRSDNPEHEVAWNGDSVLGNVSFSPAIFCQEAVYNCVLSESDDVCDLWIGKSVNFEIGTKVAISVPYTLSSSVQHMLRFCPSESVAPGQIQAKICADADFRFDVEVSKDVYRVICAPREGEGLLRRAVVINAMSACLALLAKDYGDTNADSPWREIPNLVSLSDDIESRGLPAWDQQDFSPEKTATALYPYAFQGDSDVQDTE